MLKCFGMYRRGQFSQVISQFKVFKHCHLLQIHYNHSSKTVWRVSVQDFDIGASCVGILRTVLDE